MGSRNSGKNYHLTSFRDILVSVCAMEKWGHQRHLFHLVRNWSSIAGEQVARLTSPAYFRRDVLWISVQDSAWMQHLQYAKLDLLKQVNGATSEIVVTDIRWLLQPPRPSHQRQMQKIHPVDPKELLHFKQMVDIIPDQDCRQALERLWQAFASHDKSD